MVDLAVHRIEPCRRSEVVHLMRVEEPQLVGVVVLVGGDRRVVRDVLREPPAAPCGS